MWVVNGHHTIPCIFLGLKSQRCGTMLGGVTAPGAATSRKSLGTICSPHRSPVPQQSLPKVPPNKNTHSVHHSMPLRMDRAVLSEQDQSGNYPMPAHRGKVDGGRVTQWHATRQGRLRTAPESARMDLQQTQGAAHCWVPLRSGSKQVS